MRVPILGSVLRRVFQALGVLVLLASNAWAGSAHPNLVAWYRAENNALDSSGNGNHGQWSGTEAYTNAVYGSGFEMHESRIDTGIDDWSGHFTFAAWVDSDGGDNVFGGLRSIFSKWDVGEDTNDFYFAWQHAVPHLRFTFFDSAGNRTDMDRAWATTASLHHVAVAWDGSHIRMYIDGVQLGAAIAFSGAMRNTTGRMVNIGSNVQTVTEFDGMIDDARYFNAALRPSDIRRVMHGKQPLYRY